jgi:hypothetical protein
MIRSTISAGRSSNGSIALRVIVHGEDDRDHVRAGGTSGFEESFAFQSALQTRMD